MVSKIAAEEIFKVASTMFGEKAMIEMAANKIEALLDEQCHGHYNQGHDDGYAEGLRNAGEEPEETAAHEDARTHR